MKLSEYFDKEWDCQASTYDPCLASDNSRDPVHAHCQYLYVARLSPDEFDSIKDMKIT